MSMSVSIQADSGAGEGAGQFKSRSKMAYVCLELLHMALVKRYRLLEERRQREEVEAATSHEASLSAAASSSSSGQAPGGGRDGEGEGEGEGERAGAREGSQGELVELPPPLTHVSAAHRNLLEEGLGGMGRDVGLRLGQRITRTRAASAEVLEIFKFLCTDCWKHVFNKPADALKTSPTRDLFVLHDKCFPWVSKLSGSDAREAARRAAEFLYFPSGIIVGLLASMGLTVSVSFDILELPHC